MKSTNLKLLMLFVAAILLFSNCKKNKEDEEANLKTNVVPTTFKVDIPDAISRSGSLKTTNNDTLQGNDIYQMLTLFIAVGEGASDVVQNLMIAIAQYNISEPMIYPYSGDDGRGKKITVENNTSYEGKAWEYQMTVIDVASETESDGGKALQVFWNKKTGVIGIAILKPYNINRTADNLLYPNTMYRIDYSELEPGYDATMTVMIDGFPIPNPGANTADSIYSISELKMWAGKKGDIVEVKGNTNHPRAKLFTATQGFNWAFVAASNKTANIGIAEVGLPPSNNTATDRATLLETFSLRKVFHDGVVAAWPNADSVILNSYLNSYLKNTQAPGFFNNTGFVTAGTAPTGSYASDYNSLKSIISNFAPYSPAEIKNIVISFK